MHHIYLGRMESSTEVLYLNNRFTEEEKIALTLAVVFAVLVIVGLGSFIYWYLRISKKRFQRQRRLAKERPRSWEDIEKDLRDLLNGDETKKPPISSSQVDIFDKAESRRSVSSEEEAQAAQQPIRVVRADNQSKSTKNMRSHDDSPPRDQREDNSKHNTRLNQEEYILTPLTETHIGVGDQNIRDPALKDTHIGRPKAKQRASTSDQRRVNETRVSTIYSSNLDSHADQGYNYSGGLLWPDVVDPYNRGQEMELRIGHRAVDVFLCRSLTTITKFHK